MRMHETHPSVRSLKYFTSKQSGRREFRSFDDVINSSDVTGLGEVNINWFTDLTEERVRSSSKPSEAVNEGDILAAEDNGCAHQALSQSQLILSDEWDSPRLPYTWTPASSEAHSPLDVGVASRGSSKSSSPSALAASLGVNLDGSALSWTSSLETPPHQTPVRDNHISGQESSQILPSSSRSLSNAKRLPRALFSPNKTADSDVLGVGLCSTSYGDEETIVEEPAVLSYLPFTSSPLCTSTVACLKKQESSQNVCNLMSTPQSPWESPVHRSPRETCLIESTLSDFFDTPVKSLQSRRRQAPRKKRKGNSGGIPSPVIGPDTPCESPLHSILSADKKPRTPASVKRVRFADEFDNSPCSKVAKIYGNISANNLESTELGTSGDNTDVTSVANLCNVSSMEQKTKDSRKLAAEENRTTLTMVDQAVTASQTEVLGHSSSCFCGSNLYVEETLGSTSPKQVGLVPSKNSSVRHNEETSSTCHQVVVTDDDMFSQVSAEALIDMCEVMVEEPKERAQSDHGQVSGIVTRSEALESVKKVSVQTESKEVPIPACSSVEYGDIQHQICEEDKVGFSSSASKSDRSIDEELFTQISPGFMDGILDNAKVVEEKVDKETASSSIQGSQNVDNLRHGDCKVSSDISQQFSCDNITSSTESRMPKTGRVRRGKSKQFLYPSVQQINSSCPKKVFGFKPGSHDGSPVVFVQNSEASDSFMSLTTGMPKSQNDIAKKKPAEKMSLETHSEVMHGKTAKAQLFTTNTAAPTRNCGKQVSCADFKSFSELMKDCDLDSSFEYPSEVQDHFPTKACTNVAENQLPLGKDVVPQKDFTESIGSRGQMEKQATGCKAEISSHVKFNVNSQTIMETNRSEEIADVLEVSSRNETERYNEYPVLTPCLFLDQGDNKAPVGFKTASGKGFRLSNTSLNRAKSLVAECMDEGMASVNLDEGVKIEGESCILNGNTTSLKDFGGLTTADGKDVEVTEESTKRSVSLLQEFETEHTKKEIGIGQSTAENITTTITTGYSPKRESEMLHNELRTEGGDCLQTSKKSLEKLKSLVEENLDENVGIIDSVKYGKIMSSDKRMGMDDALIGFKTAGGKDVNIKKESLEKAKSLLHENADGIPLDKSYIELKFWKDASFEIEGKNCNKENIPVLNSMIRSNGFTVAEGKDVRIGEEGLAKAQTLLEGIESRETLETETKQAFHTEFSETWLDVAEGDYGEQTGIRSLDVADAVPPFGFITAGGKGVKISKESLDKARALVVDTENTVDETLESKIFEHQSYIFQGKHTSNRDQNRNVIERNEAQNSPILKSWQGVNNEGIVNCIRAETVGSLNVSLLNNNKKQLCAAGSPITKPNVPKGFQPFKPPRLTPKRETNNSNLKSKSSKSEVNVCEAELQTTSPCNRSFDDSIADEDLCAHLSTFDVVKCHERDVVKSRKAFVIPENSSVQIQDKDSTSVKNFAHHDCLDAVFVEGMTEEIQDGLPPKQKTDEGITKPSQTQRQSMKAVPGPVNQVTPSEEFETIDLEMDDAFLEAMMVDMTTTVSMAMSPQNSAVPAQSLKRSRHSPCSDNEAFQFDLERLPKEMKITISSSESSCSRKDEGNRSDDGQSSQKRSGQNVRSLESVADQNSVLGTDNTENTQKTKETCSINIKTIAAAGDSLFKTGTGRTINISEKALKQVECVIESTDPNSAMAESSEQQTCGLKRVPHIHDAGVASHDLFQTASGKTVSVSDKTLQLARMSLKEDMVMECSGTEGEGANQDFCGIFQTASGKMVTVSEIALQKAKTNLQERSSETFENVKEVYKLNVDSALCDLSIGGSMFQSAPGKGIKISEEFFKATSAQLPDSGDELTVRGDQHKNLNRYHSGKTQDICLFQTASGKGMRISEQALVEAEAHLGGTEGNTDGTLITMPSISENQGTRAGASEKAQGRSLFQTALGKCVSISEKELFEAKPSLCETKNNTGELITKLVSQNENRDALDEVQGCRLFKTASAKNVSISEKALFEAKARLCEAESDMKAQLVTKPLEANGQNTSRNGPGEIHGRTLFQTASGESVSISEKALFEAKAHLCEGVGVIEIPETKPLTSVSPSTNRAVPKKALGNTLFQTASGKNVSISEKALLEAKAHFHENECGVNMASSTSSSQNLSNFETVQSAKQSGGLFQTASGKDVNISEKALLEAKVHLSDSGDSMGLAEAQASCLFQTASGKGVSVSQKALQEARTYVSDPEGVQGGPVKYLTSSMRTKEQDGQLENSSLFQTASGNVVSICVKALKEAKHKLDQNEENVQDVQLCKSNMNEHVQNKKPSLSPGGSIFQTSSGRHVSVLDHSVIEVRKSVENDNDKQNTTSALTVNASGTHHSKPPSVFTAKLADIIYEPHSREVVSTPVKTSVPTRTNTNISNDGQSKNDEIQKYSINDVSLVIRNGGNSVYRRSPRFSTPEASFRDCAYRRGHEFHPRHCDTGPSNISIGVPGSTSKTPLPPTQTKSSFKTPYKAGKAPENLDTNHSSATTHSSTCDSVSDFNPFISGAGGASVGTHGSPLLTPTRAKVMASSPNHVPSCSSDNLAEIDIVETQSSQSCASSELGKDGGRTGDAVSRSELQENAIPGLQMARLQQDKIISQKKRTTVRPCAGKLMTLKKNIPSEERLKLSEVMGNRAVQSMAKSRKLQTRSSSRSTVTSKTAEDFRFDLTAHFGTELLKQGSGVILGDGIKLLPADDCSAGKAEFYRAFITHENVEPKLISEDWLYNHYRWVVWKLAAYEVHSPHLWAGRCLTPDMVMLQLKYRYDREIDNCQRPALRKILEHDDTAGKRMVLCISDVIVSGGEDSTATQGTDTPAKPHQQSQVELELTDGWYCIRAVVDMPLQELIKTGRLECGDKLCVCGTELAGSEEPANPMQAPCTARLKLCANSTRKARWDSMLGYQPKPHPFSLALSSLLAGGGVVPAVDVVVVRVYPKMFFEKLSDGRSVFRNSRAEQKADAAYWKKAEVAMEQLYCKLQQELECQEDNNEKPQQGKQKRQLKESEIESLCTGQEVYEAISSSLEPHTIEMALSSHQVALLQEHRQKLMDQKRQQLQVHFQKALKEKQESQPVRNVVPLLKVRVAGCHLLDVDAKLTCLLTIWRPSEDVQSLLTEGRKLRIYNLTVGAARSRLSSSDIQLTATRSTRYQDMTVEENFLDQVYEPREVQLVQDLMSQAPAYGEADFVGIVLKTEISDLPSERGCENVFVVDPQGCLAVLRVWGGLQSLELQDVLVLDKCFVGSNLLYRGKKWKGLVAFDLSSEITCFTQSPSSRLFQSGLSQAQAKMKDEAFMRQAHKSLESVLGMSQPRGSETDPLLAACLVTPRTDLLTSYLSTPQTPESSTIDPRKSLFQAKSTKLARCSGGPPLSPLNTPIPKTVRKAFRPPRKQATPQ